LFAFDADTSPCEPLWSANLIDSGHGGTSGEIPVPYLSSGPWYVGAGDGDIEPEIGVVGTPVIDPASNTLYVVSKSMNSGGTTFYQRLHAIDITTGNEKSGAPANITASVTPSGGGTVAFNARTENQRPGLALNNGTVYIAWGAHEDTGPYYGWVLGYAYQGGTLTQTAVFNDTPNGTAGGIWMSGGAPAIDADNNVYVISGNGIFDASNTTAPNTDYGDSFLQLTSTLAVHQYYTPQDQQNDYSTDGDFGAGGAVVLADLPAGSPVTHIAIGGGKDGNLYLLNRDAMGGYDTNNTLFWQQMSIGSIFETGAFWNNGFYIATVGKPIVAYQLNTSTVKLSKAGAGTNPSGYGFPGATPSVSASGTSNGIVWALSQHNYCTPQSGGCGPAILYAYDATNVANELWDSSQVSGDAAGYAVKFTVPTVANGKVYVGTRGNNTGGVDSSTSTPGELDVYGLKPAGASSSARAQRRPAPAARGPADSTIPTHRAFGGGFRGAFVPSGLGVVAGVAMVGLTRVRRRRRTAPRLKTAS
jgi:hypothetical protein